jgi:hypothetical protein
MTLSVNDTPDWKVLRERGLTAVVDPLVFRAADVFLRGAPQEGDAELWEALSKNVDALTVFIDQLMLNDRLPIFDYGVTWEPELAGSSRTLTELCNDIADDELLVDVHVDGAAYQRARDPAIAAVKELPGIEPSLAADIREELSVLDYRWRPRLDELGDLDEQSRLLASFRYGGLLFHYYAESISDRRQRLDKRAEHVLHAKRGRIMLASSLAPGGQLRLDEQKLMRTLHRVEKDTDGAVESVDLRAPTFLPYLLSKQPETPRRLLELALKERRGGLVRSYREWRQRLLADLADGRITRKTRRELAAMAAELQRQARGDATVDIHLSYAADWKALIGAVTGNPAALLAGASVTADVNEKSLRYRLATVLPGRGYRKLISRLVASQQEYFAIERAMRNVWYGEGGTGGR